MGNAFIRFNGARGIILAAFCLLLGSSPSAAESLESPVLALKQVVTNNFLSPTSITHAGDGSQRMFVAQQDGRIWIIMDGQVLPQPFLNLSSQVATNGPEQGLLGLAFPPNFRSSQHFYAYYTVATNPPFQRTRTLIIISRFNVSLNPNYAPARSEEVLLRIEKTEDYHNGGQLAFGPDGYLYIGIGDGGPHGDPENRAQNLKTFFGKILRIDVENSGAGYRIPPNNPFVGDTNAVPEIWAYGLRNPWRFSFDRDTGDLYIGDVGEGAFEEVDVQPAHSPGGQNYGWPIVEGPINYNVPAGFTNFPSLTGPIVYYDHLAMGGDGGRGSVTGGYVYRGPNPGRMGGMYLYGDFTTGHIWGMRKVDDQWETNALRQPFDGPYLPMSTFGEDESGHLYLADYLSGTVYQLSDSGKVWTPEFSPRQGAISTQKLLITSQTRNAEIHYTTDNSEPTLSSPIVPEDGRITIADGATVRARAFRDGLLSSDVRTASFNYRTGAPIFTPAPYATVLSNTLVTLHSDTPNATIYYVTNSYWPEDPTPYIDPLVITGDLHLEAIAVAPGFGTSIVSYAQITVAKVATPWIDPPGGYCTNGTRITISCSTPNATLYHRVKTAVFTSPWQSYTYPLTLNGAMTVEAYADLPSYARSNYRSISFYPAVARPVFDPPEGTPFVKQFTLSCPTPGASIYYTIDPYGTANSVRYSGPVTITNSVLVYAQAFLGTQSSLEQSIFYSWPRVNPPLFDPPSGPLTNGSTVSINSSTAAPGQIFRYTLDGSEPDVNSPIYTGPIKVTPPITPGYLPGYVTSVRYGLLNFESTFVTTFAGSTNHGGADGPRTQASFFSPTGVCLDSKGNLYVLDSGNRSVRKIAADGVVTTIMTGLGYNPFGICVDPEDNIYIGDPGGCNRIWIIASDGNPTLFATMSSDCFPNLNALSYGLNGVLYIGSDSALEALTPEGLVETIARGNQPGWDVAPAADHGTNVYFAAGTSLYKAGLRAPVELFGGGTNSVSDGPLGAAGFETLSAIASDNSGGFLLGEYMRVRRVKGGQVTTIAGQPVAYGEVAFRNGPGNLALLTVGGICVDTNGTIFIADSQNNCIRKIQQDSAGVGLPDDWQLAHFRKIGIDPADDPDGDSITNHEEFWAGTDPNNAASFFSMDLVVRPNSNGALDIGWSTVPQKHYQLQFSKDLLQWSNFGPEVTGDGSNALVTDATPPYRNAHWFYRVSITNP
jgi:glucose/arabinose dehydrogenase